MKQTYEISMLVVCVYMYLHVSLLVCELYFNF
jgi:hypothetical protein